MGPGSICPMPGRFFSLSNACTIWLIFRAPASDWPRFGVSSITTAAASGPSPKSAAERRYTSRFLIPGVSADNETKSVIVHLIDGTYELFRHFYGLRRFTKGNDRPFGAVVGVLNTVLQMIEEGGTHVG